MLFRFAAVLAAWGLGCSLASAGQIYRDPKYGFRIAFPDGWEVSVEKAEGGSVAGLLASPKAVCVAVVEEAPDTKTATQAELDAAMREPLGPEFWLDREAGGGPGSKMISHGVRVHASGRTVQDAVIDHPASSARASGTTAMTTILATPGMAHIVLCMTGTKEFSALRPVLSEVIESYRPKSENLTAVALEEDASISKMDRAPSEGLRAAKRLVEKAWLKRGAP
jgi:hypothetical protein